MVTPPHELYVNPQTRGLYVTDGLLKIMPGTVQTAKAVDAAYRNDTWQYANRLTDSVRAIESPFGIKNTRAAYSIFYDERSDKPTAVDFIIAPLNDCPPLGNATIYSDYVTNPKATEEDRERAQPNSFRRAIKASNVHEANIAENNGRPTIVLYATSTDIFTSEQKALIEQGITTPYGELAESILEKVQEEIHGTNSETQIQDVFVSASGTAHLGVGVADHLKQTGKYNPMSLMANNLIANVSNVLISQPKAVANFLDRFKLLRFYSVRQYYGEAGQVDLDKSTHEMPETKASADGDKLGSEKAMRKRQFNAMLDFASLSATMKSDYVSDAINRLLNDDVMVTLPRSHNARITKYTDQSLPESHPNLERLEIKSGVKDKKIGLITGEFDRLDYTLVVHGAKRALESR